MEKFERFLIKCLFVCGIILLINWLFVWPTPPRFHVMTDEEVWEMEHLDYINSHPEEFIEEEELEKTEKQQFDTFQIEKKNGNVTKKDIQEATGSRASKKRAQYVTATFYNATVDQCDGDPLQPADPNVKIDKQKLKAGKVKWIAISRDLQQHYKFGDKVKIICKDDPRLNGVYEIHDLLNAQARKQIDILIHESKNSDFPQGVWKNVEIKKL